MFKYVKFTKVETVDTVLEFRGGSEDVKVNHFDVDVVSISSEDESAIDALIASQPAEINCKEINQAEFKSLVTNSAQLNRIRDIVKAKIAKKYSPADEIAMLKKAEDDDKRVAYNNYVKECLEFGDNLKKEIGYAI